MNYDHLKETKTIIKPGVLVLDGEVHHEQIEGYYECGDSVSVEYLGNISGYAQLRMDIEKDMIIVYSKEELLVLSSFLKDIAETL
jgi:hypothetical protein